VIVGCTVAATSAGTTNTATVSNGFRAVGFR
jgi:hypothetical protein